MHRGYRHPNSGDTNPGASYMATTAVTTVTTVTTAAASLTPEPPNHRLAATERKRYLHDAVGGRATRPA